MGGPEDAAAERYFTPPEDWKVEDFDKCECGDYRYQHRGGVGECLMPNDACHGFKECEAFRLSLKATEIPETFRLCPLCGKPSPDGREHQVCVEREKLLAAQPDPHLCPICGSRLNYDEVDIGVGVQTGNYRCDYCGWTPERDSDEESSLSGKFEGEL